MLAVRAPQSKPASVAFSMLERIHQGDDIDGERRLLAIAEGCRLTGSASCRSRADTARSPGSPPTPASARRRHSCGCRRASRAEERPQDQSAGQLGISDIQDAGIDLLQRRKRGVRARLDHGNARRFCLPGLGFGGSDAPELHGSYRDHCSAQKAPTILVDVFGHCTLQPARCEGPNSFIMRDRCKSWGAARAAHACSVCDVAHRSDLNAARISDTKSSGCSQAAKWPPLSSLL